MPTFNEYVQNRDEGTVFVSGNRSLYAPGVVIGRNVRLSERFYIEFYAGPKYRFWSKTTKQLVYQVPETETTHYQKLGLRGGFNMGFRFG